MDYGIHLPPYGFLRFTQKIFIRPIPEFFGWGYPYVFSQKFSLHPLTTLFGHPVQEMSYFFSLYQKIIK